ncbi:MAG: hypothetical protein AB7K41_16340, partial [Bdellovibrionales bacterium]
MMHLFALGLLSLSVQAANFNAIGPNNEGVKSLVKENQYGAYQKFAEAAAEDSFDPTIRLNLGLTYSLNKEPDKALAEYKMAEQLAGDDKQVKFMALFNQGVELGAK